MAIVESDGYHTEPNFVPASINEEVLVALVDVLVAAGWTVIARSDGSTVTSDGSENTSGQWANASAWTHLRDPTGAGGRDLSIQRGASHLQLRMYISLRGDPMTGGNATTPPTPSGINAQLIGSGGSYDTSFFPSTPANIRWHMSAGEAPEATSGDVYPFYIIGRATPGGAASKAMILAPVTTSADGVVGDADDEPWCAFVSSSLTSGVQVSAWFKANLVGEAFVVAGLAVESQPTNMRGLNPYSGLYDQAQIMVHDSTGGLLQRKGVIPADFMRWEGDSAHASLESYNLATEGNSFALFDDMAIRWPHATSIDS